MLIPRLVYRYKDLGKECSGDPVDPREDLEFYLGDQKVKLFSCIGANLVLLPDEYQTKGYDPNKESLSKHAIEELVKLHVGFRKRWKSDVTLFTLDLNVENLMLHTDIFKDDPFSLNYNNRRHSFMSNAYIYFSNSNLSKGFSDGPNNPGVSKFDWPMGDDLSNTITFSMKNILLLEYAIFN